MIFIIIVIFSVVGIISINKFEAVYSQNVLKQLSDTAIIEALFIEEYIRESTEPIVDLAKLYEKYDYQDNHEKILESAALLSKARKITLGFDDGRSYTSKPSSPTFPGGVGQIEIYDPRTRPWYQYGIQQEGFSIGDIFYTKKLEPIVPAVHKIKNGVILSDVRLTYLQDIIDSLDLYEDSYAVIVNESGQTLASNFADVGTMAELINSVQSVELSPAVNNKLSFKQANVNDVERYVFSTDININNEKKWQFIIAINKDIALKPIHDIVLNLQIIYLGILVSGVVIILLLSRYLIFPAFNHYITNRDAEQNLQLKKEHMIHVLHHDPLTDLLNRLGLEESLPTDFKNYACLIADISMLRAINDTFGHAAGDRAIKEIASRLRDRTPLGGFIARLDGDEFTIIFPDISDVEQCHLLGQAVVNAFSKPIRFNEEQLQVQASIGIAVADREGENIESVLMKASKALYQFKGSGATQYEIYSDNIKADIPNLERKQELYKAIKANEFCPWYQGKYDSNTQELVSFEALCRWDHPQGDLLTPYYFLEDIDKYNLQLELTESILLKVLRQLELWSYSNLRLIPVSINITADTLASGSGIETIELILKKYNQFKQYLIFEITEDVFDPEITQAVKVSISRLINLDVKISIDDFGSGYASFRHLSEFAFHELKIDQSFVNGIGKDPSAEVILNAFINIAQGLKVKSVAEGIETQEQLIFLKKLGFDLIQGYLFSKPIKAEDATELLQPLSTLQELSFRRLIKVDL